MKYLLLYLCLFISNHSFSSDLFHDEFTASTGLAMISFTEGEKSIQGENVQEAASGTVTAMSLNVQYKMAEDFKKSYYISATFPLLPSAEGTYIAFGGGMEYYFNDVGAKVGLFNSGTTINFTPNFRYFIGAEVGGGYLVYNTESAKKSDALFEIGGNGGIVYSMSDSWAIKAVLGVMKGSGVVTSTLGIRAFVGATFYL